MKKQINKSETDERDSDGIELERVIEDPTDAIEEMVCSICYKIFLDPIACSKCENHFCKICISSWKVKNKTKCPYSCDFVERPCSSLMKTLLSKLVLKCINEDKGCFEPISYLNLVEHEKNCKYKLLKKNHNNTDNKTSLGNKEVKNKDKYYKIFNNRNNSNNSNSNIIRTKNNNLRCNSNNNQPDQYNIIKILQKPNDEIIEKRDSFFNNFQQKYLDQVADDYSNQITPSSLINKEINTNNIKLSLSEKINMINAYALRKKIYFLNAEFTYNNIPVIVRSKQFKNINLEEILTIPANSILSVNNTKNSILFNNLNLYLNTNKIKIENFKRLALTLELLNELDKDLHFKNYIKIISSDLMPNSALLFKEDEINYLKGSSLYEQIRIKKNEMSKCWNIIENITTNRNITYDDFIAIYLSIINGNIINSKFLDADNYYFIPFFSILVNNNCLSKPSKCFIKLSSLNNDFEIYKLPKSTLNHSEEITIPILNISNQDLLLDFGFTYPDNPQNYFEIYLFLNDRDPLYNFKLGLLEKKQEPFIIKLTDNFGLHNIGELISYLRIIESEFKFELTKNLDYYTLNAINLENEKKVFNKLEMILNYKLKNYETSIDHDNNLLNENSGRLNNNEKHCINLRLSEKNIIMSFLKFVNEIKAYLNLEVSYPNSIYFEYLNTIEKIKK